MAASAAPQGGPSGAARTSLLPPEWVFARDFLVLAGRGTAALVQQLRGRGQERLVVFLSPGEEDELPAGVPIVRTLMELMTEMHRFTGDFPLHAVVRRVEGASIDAELHREIGRTVERTLASLQLYRTTIDKMGERWTLNGVRNLPRLAAMPSIASLEGAFAGRPCAIVSPGPSLAKNVHLLAELQDRALILCSTHALLPLQTAGIRPDFVLAADPSDHIQRHFHGVDMQGFRAFLIGAANDPGQYDLPVRRRIAFGSNTRIDSWIFSCFGEEGDLHTGGSVACSALSLALHMGCDRILLVGQDLSFSEGRYYVDSAHDGDSELELDDADGTFVLARNNGAAARPGEDPIGRNTPEPLREVRGYHGGTVRTSASFAHFLAWFETVARSTTSAELLNCTEGGAYIDGMRHVPLRQAIAEWRAELFDIEAILEQAVGGLDFAERGRRTLERLEQMLAGLADCTELAGCCDKLAKRAVRDQRALDRLGGEERKLSAALAPVVFISILAQAKIRAATKKGAEAKTLEDNLAGARELFSIVLGAGKLLRQPLQHSRDELAAQLAAGAS